MLGLLFGDGGGPVKEEPEEADPPNTLTWPKPLPTKTANQWAQHAYNMDLKADLHRRHAEKAAQDALVKAAQAQDFTTHAQIAQVNAQRAMQAELARLKDGTSEEEFLKQAKPIHDDQGFGDDGYHSREYARKSEAAVKQAEQSDLSEEESKEAVELGQSTTAVASEGDKVKAGTKALEDIQSDNARRGGTGGSSGSGTRGSSGSILDPVKHEEDMNGIPIEKDPELAQAQKKAGIVSVARDDEELVAQACVGPVGVAVAVVAGQSSHNEVPKKGRRCLPSSSREQDWSEFLIPAPMVLLRDACH